MLPAFFYGEYMKELRKMHAHIGHLVQEADYDDLREYLGECLNTLDRGPLLPERFHKPVLTTLKREGLWSHAEMLCRDLEVSYGDILEEDESIKRMLRSGRKSIAAVHTNPPLVNPKRKGEEWFVQKSDPPTTHPEHGTRIDSMFFGYLTEGEVPGELKLGARIHDEDNFLTALTLTYSKEEFEEHLVEGVVKPNSSVEIIVYDGDHLLYYITENL